MKTYSKYFNFVSTLLLIASIILMVASKGFIVKEHTDYYIRGSQIVFGGQALAGISGPEGVKASPIALLGFILILAALIAIYIAGTLKMLRENKAGKVYSLILLAAAFVAIIGGIMLFSCKTNYFTTNGSSAEDAKQYKMSAGWIISGIAAILGGVCSAVDPVCSMK